MGMHVSRSTGGGHSPSVHKKHPVKHRQQGQESYVPQQPAYGSYGNNNGGYEPPNPFEFTTTG